MTQDELKTLCNNHFDPESEEFRGELKMKNVRINKVILIGDTQPTYFVDYKIGKDCWKNYGSSRIYDSALQMKKEIIFGEVSL